MKTKYLSVAILLTVIACDTIDDSQDSKNPVAGLSSSSQEISSSSSFEIISPQMDERVVAYMWGDYEEPQQNKIITDMNKLKEIFKTALNEENFDSECDYFAISVPIYEGLSYLVLSKDQSVTGDVLAVYNIHPSLDQPNAPNWAGDGSCMYPQTADIHGILVCDKKGGLRDRINFPPVIRYNDPTWYCWGNDEARNRPFFEFREIQKK